MALSVILRPYFQNVVKKKRIPVLKKYPDYWGKKKIDRNKFWWLRSKAVSTYDEVPFDYGIDVVEGPDHEEKVLFNLIAEQFKSSSLGAN